MFRYLVLATLFALPSFSAQAHHSRSHFSREVTEMEGTLLELRWRNPHIHFMLETTEANGETKIWEMEAGTIYVIGRAGVTREMFEVGDKLRVAGNRSDLYDEKFWVTNILLPAGRVAEERTEVLVVNRGGPRWTGEVVGGRDQWTDEALYDSPTANAENGFFRVWTPAADRGSFVPIFRDPEARPLNQITTEAAQAARETWDPFAFDDACEVPGLPRVNHGPHPHQFIDGDDRVLLVSEEFDVTRTLHLASTVDPESQPYSPLGYSVAEWEDENTLVVETTRINFPYMDLGGTGQSDQVRIVERYKLS